MDRSRRCGCTTNRGYVPCWAPANYFWDAFRPDGRFLGELEVPESVTHRTPTFLGDEVFLAVVQDDAGTIMVKRYRLVLPGKRNYDALENAQIADSRSLYRFVGASCFNSSNQLRTTLMRCLSPGSLCFWIIRKRWPSGWMS